MVGGMRRLQEGGGGVRRSSKGPAALVAGPVIMLFMLVLMALHIATSSWGSAQQSARPSGGRSPGQAELLEWYKADPNADGGKLPPRAKLSGGAGSSRAGEGGMIAGKPWAMQIPGVARPARAPVNEFGLHKFALDDDYVQWRKEPWFWEVREGEEGRLPGVNVQSSYPMDLLPLREMAETLDHPFEDR
ncbi:hypothetical protein GUITHDRAFT_154063 [Guillardia theta CCMP2712]|uniref:Uncharacterized protein n=1 Tax=Guillardia theta (strain CCMP2712) TaxID=905079 RepID=L1IWR7_GUITC|nr:hypothetical protein GUITHDRAFT_154063 [Guillardia theta CCMP2712]EKX40718.1 hypothetical protein GUITHDRAFT_154063 [Guillardia theta CCMP2712]|eukprot:XP_005827698.1 hypothetical protein GUITHDRAFT_154063 [Guillardia theta CCMP2712]